MKILPASLLCAALALGAAGPASAKTYEGETAGGYAISFKANGSKVSKLEATVPAVCVPVGSGTARAGGELFQPPGSFAYGRTTKTKALQQPAMHTSEVTKNYHVTVKRTRRGVAGKLHVNFSYQSLTFDVFGNMGLQPWICQGHDTFKV